MKYLWCVPDTHSPNFTSHYYLREAQLKTLSIIPVCPHSTNHFWSLFFFFGVSVYQFLNVFLFLGTLAAADYPKWSFIFLRSCQKMFYSTSWFLWFLMIKIVATFWNKAAVISFEGDFFSCCTISGRASCLSDVQFKEWAFWTIELRGSVIKQIIFQNASCRN